VIAGCSLIRLIWLTSGDKLPCVIYRPHKGWANLSESFPLLCCSVNFTVSWPL